MTARGFAPGRYRLEATDELVAFVERTFVAPRPAAEHDAARAEALRELMSSEIELLPDGTLISRANGSEALRVRLPSASLTERTLTFDKAPGVEVRLECISSDAIVAIHPGKPPLEFRRSGRSGI